jgi:hypothetical protein
MHIVVMLVVQMCPVVQYLGKGYRNFRLEQPRPSVSLSTSVRTISTYV